MDQDIEDRFHRDPDGVLHLMRDSVGSFDGHEGVNVDMHVDQKAIAHPADQRFLDAIHFRNARGGGADLRKDLRGGLGVHEIFEGGA